MTEFFSSLAFLNNSKVLAGISMILMNVGSRHIISDLGIIHNNVLSSEIFKKIIIFAMFFVATRDVVVAFLLTLSYIFVVDGILHENRRFCIVPKKYIAKNKITVDQYVKAKAIVLEYDKEQLITTDEKPNLYEMYESKVEKLKDVSPNGA